MKRNITLIILCLFLVLDAPALLAEQGEPSGKPVATRVTVHVLAHGAKAMYPRFGARVVIRDASTNEILDQGEVHGDSGDTDALMKAGYPRTLGKVGLTRDHQGVIAVEKSKGSSGRPLLLTPENLKQENVEAMAHTPESGAARFVGTIQISKPTVVRIEATGPLKHPQATMTDTVTALILPGHDVTGEGIVLTLRGLVVDILSPAKGEEVPGGPDKAIQVAIHMSMMCGCPILEHPDNPWQPAMYTLFVEAFNNGKLYFEKELQAPDIITGMSAFAFSVPLPQVTEKGGNRIKLRVMGAQAALANYGMDEVEFTIH